MTKSEEYVNSKAERMYQLYMQGKPCRKVYAAVKKGDKYIVISAPGKKYKYQLSGGGVDGDESSTQALQRELLEELNVKVKNIKSLGQYTAIRTWHYKDIPFDVDYEVEVFHAEFASYANNTMFGLEGEFNTSVKIEEITKEEMLKTVYEFVREGIKLD